MDIRFNDYIDTKVKIKFMISNKRINSSQFIGRYKTNQFEYLEQAIMCNIQIKTYYNSQNKVLTS